MARSPFASRITRDIAMPGDPDARVTIRCLTPRQLERAAQVQRARAIEAFRSLGGAQLLKDLEAVGVGGASGSAGARAAARPLDLYDALTVCEAGVVSWSYQEPLPEALADLTTGALEGLADAILRLTMPEAYEDDPEAAKKDA